MFVGKIKYDAHAHNAVELSTYFSLIGDEMPVFKWDQKCMSYQHVKLLLAMLCSVCCL